MDNKQITPLASTARMDCHLLCASSPEHLSQLFTGFGLLEKNGLVKIILTRLPDYKPGVLTRSSLKVVLNGKTKIVYDTFDGNDVYSDDLAWCDFYFKRSYDKNFIVSLKQKQKIFPLGFNYSAYGPNDYSFLRLIWGMVSVNSFSDMKQASIQFFRLNTLLSYFLRTGAGRASSFYSNFEDLPRFDLPNRVIFFTRLWDPSRIQNVELKEERERMLQMRVEMIRKLKKYFGSFFWGGLEPTEFSIKYFRDCIVEDPKIVYKKNYLKLLRESSIGIATTGLLNSNGWKIAEYIAGSKAIVSESLLREVPGDFQSEGNYLSYKTSDECVEQVGRLICDRKLRFDMMLKNFIYYHSYLRPDILVWNTLKICL